MRPWTLLIALALLPAVGQAAQGQAAAGRAAAPAPSVPAAATPTQAADTPLFLDIFWTVDGQAIQSPAMRLALERRLRQAGFRPVRTEDQATATLVLGVAARRNTEMLGVFSSYAELSAQVYDMATGRELYAASFDRERGLHLSFEEAGRLAIEHALSRFVEHLLPEVSIVSEAFYRQTGQMEMPADERPPEIVILEPALTRGIKLVRKTPTVRIRGRVLDASPIASVEVNGQPVLLDTSSEFVLDVPVEEGDNPVVVSAVDAYGNVSESAFELPRERAQAPVDGRYVALVIGIDSYDGVWAPLDNASGDAVAVAAVLQDEYGFDEVTTLLNEEATRVNILRAFERLIENTGQHDNVLIYYAGHGDYQDRMRRGFWVPADAETRSIIDFIPNSVIRDLVRGIPSRHTLLIADACFAGEVFRGEDLEAVSPTGAEDVQAVRWVPSRKAMTSGGVEPVMDGGVEGHSLFASELLRALRSAREPLPASAVFQAIRGPVVERTPQTPVFSAIGDAGDEGGQFVFVRRQ